MRLKGRILWNVWCWDPIPCLTCSMFHPLCRISRRAVYQVSAGIKTTGFFGKQIICQETRGKKQWERRMAHLWESSPNNAEVTGETKKAHLTPKDFQNRGPLGIQVGRETSSKEGPSKPKKHPDRSMKPEQFNNWVHFDQNRSFQDDHRSPPTTK